MTPVFLKITPGQDLLFQILRDAMNQPFVSQRKDGLLEDTRRKINVARYE